MGSVLYNGEVVESVIGQIKSISNTIPNISSGLRSATSKIISAKGFSRYVGGVSSDTFSGVVDKCGEVVNDFQKTLRQKQVSVLAYSNDANEINTFLNGLSRSEFDSLDLTELNSYIGLDRRAGNILKGVGSSIATFGLSLFEGVGELLETGADLVVLAGSGAASIFTGAADWILGGNRTQELWENTRAFVSDKKVESIFNSIYNDTELGKSIKENAYGFDTVRGIGKGLGYTVGLIGANILTGGIASGLGVGAAGSISAGQLAMSAGVLGFANGTEEAWAEGATIENGLLYGAASGAWEGLQWYAGAKINQYGGLGDRIAQGIFKGAAKGVGTRIAMDTVDSALEGFVQPALSMIYKDYGQGSFIDNYKTAFAKAGGWKNVGVHAVMGGIASGIGEYIGARRLLKAANADEGAKEIFASEGGDGQGRVLGSTDGEMFDSPTDYKRNRRFTIDGDVIESGDTVFNSKSSKNVPKDYKWFSDGSYLPTGDTLRQAQSGVLGSCEGLMSADEMISLIQKNKTKLSGMDYTSLMDAAQLFKEAGCDVNVNGLKLIAFHSEGNAGRIKSVINMMNCNIGEDAIDGLSDRLAKQVFSSSCSSAGGKVRMTILGDYIDTLRANGSDDWLSGDQILKTVDSKKLISAIRNANVPIEETVQSLRMYLGDSVPESTLVKIASCDGYSSTVRQLLMEGGITDEAVLDNMSTLTAAKIFNGENLGRIKSCVEVSNRNFSTAIELVTDSTDVVGSYHELFRATGAYSDSANRKAYYAFIDQVVDDGMDRGQAITIAKSMNIDALESVGKQVGPMNMGNTASRDVIFGWHKDFEDLFDDTPIGTKPQASEYLKQNYMGGNGKIDSSRVVDDFQALMKKKMTTLSPEGLASQGYDYQKSVKATQMFMDTYVDAVSDASNPNRGEALRFMGKILELESEGKGISIVNNAGKTGSHRAEMTINIGNQTIYSGDYDTFLHETGHYVFGTGYDTKIPSTYPSLRAAATAELDNNPGSKMALQYIIDNDKEAHYYAEYLADKEMERIIKKNGFSGIAEYKDHLTEKYASLTPSERSSRLRAYGANLGNITTDSFDETYAKKLDFKDASNCATIDLEARRQRIIDKIYRSEFDDCTKISSVIDSVTYGRTQIRYGHGPKYFEGSNAVVSSYHELIADYSALKASGDNRSIRLLRFIFGDELIDNIDYTYQMMLQ